MSDEELKLTRRFFLQQTAISTALAGGMAGIVLKTDAASGDVHQALSTGTGNDSIMPYPYF